MIITMPENYQVFIEGLFDRFKQKSEGDPLLCLPIASDNGETVGQLRPITRDFRLSLPGCPALLARWRNENPTLSAQSFTATTAGTARWLEEQIIGRGDRLLFLIVLLDDSLVGHIGFSSFEYAHRLCEVDAVLRGEPNAPPGIMTFAMRALINWGLQELGLNHIQLRVFSDNTHAIRFYKRNDFYIEAENLPAGEYAEKAYTLMRLDIPAWRKRQMRQSK